MTGYARRCGLHLPNCIIHAKLYYQSQNRRCGLPEDGPIPAAVAAPDGLCVFARARAAFAAPRSRCRSRSRSRSRSPALALARDERSGTREAIELLAVCLVLKICRLIGRSRSRSRSPGLALAPSHRVSFPPSVSSHSLFLPLLLSPSPPLPPISPFRSPSSATARW